MSASSLVRDEGVAGSNPATPTNDLAGNQTAAPTDSPTDIARALRYFVRGKPQSVRDAAHNIIGGFRTVAAGRGDPTTYRMLAANVERLGGK